MDEIGEFQWIPNEEDRSVIAYEIVISLLRVEFYGESTRIPLGVGRPLLAADSREANEDLCFLAHLGKKPGLCILGHIVGDFKEAMCPRSFGMYHAFWDSLSVEMR
jgi:hypothetical protein